MEPVDDYLLAGFLAGTLPSDQRAHVIRYLAENGDAREVLALASRALDAVGVEADVPAPSHDRAPMRRPARRPAMLSRYALAVILVITAGAGVRVFVGSEADGTDAVRGDDQTERVAPRVGSDLAARWEAVPEAVRYEVVVWDPVEALVVGRTETRAPRLDAAGEFAQTTRPRMLSGRAYVVRVDAFDAENRLLLSSDLASVMAD